MEDKIILPPEPAKTHFPIVLAVIVSLVLGAGGMFAYERYYAQPLVLPTPPPVFVSPIPQTPSVPAGWETFTGEQLGKIEFSYPSTWQKNPVEILIGSSNSGIKIDDPERVYSLTLTRQANYNDENGKPFESLQEFVKMPYPGKILQVATQEGMQYLPRAGSENVNGVNFFSIDLKYIYTLTLTTLSVSGKFDQIKIQQGQKLFDQILSTFRFNDQNLTNNGNWLTHDSEPIVSFFKGYKLHYPSTWKLTVDQNKVKDSSYIVKLSRGENTITIGQYAGSEASCLYPQDPLLEGMYAQYNDYREISKGSLVWRWAIPKTAPTPVYHVCERKPGSSDFTGFTSIGSISLSGPAISADTLDEFGQILERLEIN